MKGLELSRLYYNEVFSPLLRDKFPERKVAAGLVGEGSECYGYDDDYSKDHDWGAALCLWLNSQDFGEIGNELKRELENLPKSFQGYRVREDKGWSVGRTGVLEISQFYFRYVGYEYIPKTLDEWMRIPEINLSIATNGEVFRDPLGKFTKIRDGLLAFYPEDVRLKKIAARCMRIAQSGQYNFPRSIKRKEYVAARMAETEFIDAAGSLIFLLNKKYRPFYKWLHRALQELPILGKESFHLFSDLVRPDTNVEDDYYQHKIDVVEELSQMIIQELKNQGLSEANSDFLLHHGPMVQKRITNKKIRDLSLWQD